MADNVERGPVKRAHPDGPLGGVDEKAPGLSIPGGMPTILAFGVAVLAAIGVSGGVLVRAVRATPGTFVLVLGTLIILAVVVESTGTKPRYRLPLLALVMLVTLFALVVGASSVDQRDMPAIALTSAIKAPTTSESGNVTVTVTARGSGLRPGENMLVQVQGLTKDLPTDAESYDKVRPGCTNTVLRSRDQEQKNQYGDPAGDLLLWTQAGPDADGAAKVESSVNVEAGTFNAVCAVVVYNLSGGPLVERAFNRIQAGLGLPTGQEVRSSVSFLRLQPTEP